MSQAELEKLFLVQSGILGMLLHTLTVNYEYSRSNRENSPLLIQMPLSEKPKTFYQSFIAFFYLH